MSNEPPPFPLSNTYVPSAWEQDDTAITKENINKYAVTFPISQNSPITISNTLSVGGLITGSTTTQTANDNSTKLASTSYADNAASQSASALLADTNTFTGVNTFSNTNNSFIGTTATQSQAEADTTKLANLQWVITRFNNNAVGLASLSSNNTFTGTNTFNNDVFIGNSGLLTCGQINSGEITGTAPTQSANDNSTKLSTTSYADTSSATATNTLQNVLLTGNLTYSGNNSYTGTTTLSGTNNIGVLNGTNNLAGNVNINTANPNNNTTIGNSSGGGVLFINGGATFSGTTNLNGVVNATSTNNKTIGNTGGGITQINGTTEINSAVIGNTDIGNAGGGVTKLSGVLQLNAGASFSPTNIPASIGYGNADNIGNWKFFITGFFNYTANTSVYGLTNTTALPYGRYAFNMRIFIQSTTSQVGYINVFPCFTNTTQIQGLAQSGVQNQVSFGGQREGYIDFIFASGQRQVFNEGGFCYIDSANFNYPIVGVGFFLSQSCQVSCELTMTRIA